MTSITQTQAPVGSGGGIWIFDSLGNPLYSQSGYLDVINRFYGNTRTIRASAYVRPANTTPYSALDCISNSTVAPTPISLIPLSRDVETSNYITKLLLITNKYDCTAQIRVHFYNDDFAGVCPNDNSPFPFLWSNRSTYIGFIDLPALGTEGTGSDAAYALVDTCRLPWDTSTQTVYCILQTMTAFTPASAQSFLLVASSENM